MSRQEIDNTSFDLFLDTICNTFGGVVFLAILLAILIQTRAIVKDPERRREEAPSPAEVRELMAQLDAANAKYDAITTALERLPPTETSNVNDQYKKLVSERETLEAQIETTIREQASRTKSLGAQLVKNAELAKQNAEIPEELKKAEAKVGEKDESLKEVVSKRQTTLRLPREKASSASSLLVLLKSSRFYLAMTPSTTARTFNDEHVKTEPTVGGGVIVNPRSGRGWEMTDKQVAETIKSAKARGHVVTIAVWPNSYAEFAVLKKEMVENQVSYQLWPQRQDEQLTVYFGGGQSRVQ